MNEVITVNRPGVRLSVYAGPMAEPVPELDEEDALRGVVNQLVVHGRRMPVIIPGSVLEMMPVWAELLRTAQAKGYLDSLLPAVMPWVSVLPEGEVSVFAADLTRAVSSGTHAPERIAACLREWQASAEIHADQGEADRLRQAMREADEGTVSPWEYDEASA
jgi:hypothetical protein